MPNLDQTPKKNGLVWRIDYNKRVLNGPLTDGFTYDDYIVASADECPWIYIKDVISLTDLMATEAAILHVHLPANAGVDSVSILPALKGGQVFHPIVVASVNGSLGIRDGRWMLAMCPGSGGWTLPNPVARRDHLPPVQLYDMDTWLGITEQLNVEVEHPNVVRRLRSLLVRYIRDGRSTPGAPQHNANPQVWPQINWIKSIGPDAAAAHRQKTTAGLYPKRQEHGWWYY